MKKILIPSLIACSLFAAEQNYIELGAGFMNSKDNFSTDSKKNISSLGSAKSESEAIPYIDFYYGHNLNDMTNLYIASQMGELNLGSKLETNAGEFDFGIKADLMGEEWKNPFLTGANREKTDTKEFGAYIGYTVPSTGALQTSLRYEYSKKDYDKDEVSSVLKRDGKRHIVSVENMYFTNLFNKEAALLSNLVYEKYSADGKASTYNQYGLELGLSTQVNEVVNLTVLGNYGKKDYDTLNPEVNKTVEVDIYGAKAVVNWDRPLGYENVYASFKTGYEKENANADFYDKENTFGVVSVGYRF